MTSLQFYDFYTKFYVGNLIVKINVYYLIVKYTFYAIKIYLYK